jgi:N-methylhydantoinase B
VVLRTPGGGGHGDPGLRDPAALEADIAAGLVLDASAYGR